MKLTKKQQKALEFLVNDLDELDNKPRRLFHALEAFAIEFDVVDAIPGIREAQDRYYEYNIKGEIIKDIYSSLIDYKRSVWKRQVENEYISIDECHRDIRAAEEYADLLANNILTSNN